LLLYSSHLALGVSNWPIIYFINYMPTSSLALYIIAPSKGEVGGRPRGPHHRVARPGWAHATTWCGRLLALLRLSFGLRHNVRKIGTSAFVSSNSENISCITFLKYKNSRKQELALWHLVNRLFPENA
jgi:hypothetical protein